MTDTFWALTFRVWVSARMDIEPCSCSAANNLSRGAEIPSVGKFRPIQRVYAGPNAAKRCTSPMPSTTDACPRCSFFMREA
jgi:hypothetical protein